jgi:hypothetical protein
MDSFEYCLFICAVRAEKKGDTELANDLGHLATVYHAHETPGSDFDKLFMDISKDLNQRYGKLPFRNKDGHITRKGSSNLQGVH